MLGISNALNYQDRGECNKATRRSRRQVSPCRAYDSYPAAAVTGLLPSARLRRLIADSLINVNILCPLFVDPLSPILCEILTGLDDLFRLLVVLPDLLPMEYDTDAVGSSALHLCLGWLVCKNSLQATRPQGPARPRK